MPLLILLLTIGAVIISAQEERWPFERWQRASNDPIIAPHGDGWESAGTFNPTVVEHDGQIVMLYRAQDRNGTSRLGYATSTDGIRFARRPEPVLSPETEYEKDGGIEDPRQVLSRTDSPIFAPDAEWEKVGQVGNVVFVEGMIRQGARWLFYYGGADKHVGVAEAPARR